MAAVQAMISHVQRRQRRTSGTMPHHPLGLVDRDAESDADGRESRPETVS
jgi:hypothetical protein